MEFIGPDECGHENRRCSCGRYMFHMERASGQVSYACALCDSMLLWPVVLEHEGFLSAVRERA